MPRARYSSGVAAFVWVSLLVAAVARPAEAPWRVERGEVRVTVPLKPGGAFETKAAALAGTLTPAGSRPVKLAGEIALDLATLDTGIALRNQHLRERYLELSRGSGYDRAVLSEISIADAAGPEFEGRSAFSGSLLLHGVQRPVGGAVDIRRQATGGGARVDASFSLALTEFAVQPPEYLGVGVANKVIVRVQLTLQPGAARR